MGKDPPRHRNKERILIFTDLDGTLLDHVSYDWSPAKPALDQCKKHYIPVIMVSSKTRAELDLLSQEIGLPYPFISENGGGIFFPEEYRDRIPPGTVLAMKWWKLTIGISYDLLVQGLRQIRNELGWRIRGFSEMTLEEISHLTGLDPESVRPAMAREFDEPFIIMEKEDVNTDVLHVAAQKRGLRITEGGRFYHLHGKVDKGDAVNKLITWYEDSCDNVFTIALGDSPNDFSMLKQVDQPVLIRSQRNFPGIEDELPGLIITRRPGPEGWNSVILDILSKKIEGRNV